MNIYWFIGLIIVMVVFLAYAFPDGEGGRADYYSDKRYKRCPFCKGHGRINGTFGSIDSRECLKCRGTGKRTEDEL